MASVEDSDWRGDMTILERQKFMYTGKYACDVTFIVGDSEEKICAHQFVLVCGSVVFEQTLRNLNEKEKQAIRVRDSSAAAFHQLMHYLYCESIDLTSENVLDILAAAKHYRINPLIRKCSEYLQQASTVENVLKILDKSIEYQMATVTDKCVSLVSANARQILHSYEFTSLCKDALKLIIEQDYLEDVTEMEIFEVVIKWATEKCRQEGRGTSNEDKREVLGDLIHSIRFASMPASDFTKAMKKYKVLTSTERAELYEFIEDDEKDGAMQPPAGFTLKPCRPKRKVSEKNVATFSASPPDHSVKTQSICQEKDNIELSHVRSVCRFKEVSGTWSCAINQANAIDLQVSKSVTICGVSLYGSKEKAELAVEVRLKDDTGTTLADTGRVKVVCDGSTKPFQLMFPKQVPVNMHMTYSILAYVSGPFTHRGAYGNTKVFKEGCFFTFTASRLDQLGNGVIGGQIPEILFSNCTNHK